MDITDTDHNLELKREVQERTLHRMVKVHQLLDRWQGSQNLCGTVKESCVQNKQMTAVEYISDTEEIIKASWWNFQPDGAVAFEMSESSPVPPALSAKDLPGAQTWDLHVHQIEIIDHHWAEHDEDCRLGSISDSKNCPNWNDDYDNSNASKDHWEAHYKSNLELDNVIKAPEILEYTDVSVASNFAAFTWPTRRSMKLAE